MSPRTRIWIPWFALCSAYFWGPAFSLHAPAESLSAIVVVTLAGLFTWALQRISTQNRSHTELANEPNQANGMRALTLGTLFASALANCGAMAWMHAAYANTDLWSATATIMGEPRVALPFTAWSSAIIGVLAGILFFLLLRVARLRLLFILSASYVFYAHWDYRFLPLIFGSSTIDYWLGLKIGRTEDPKARKRWLWLTVFVNLGVLAYFKYIDFGIESAKIAFAELGVDLPLNALEIALPVGISFFTFESMSYVIDVYRRQLPPHRSYLEYLSFVAFFPHLVAGPIVRPSDLLPQLSGPARWNPKAASEGLYLIAWGLLKKVAIGDYLAVNLIDRVFDAPASYSSLECYVAAISYSVQIYCDFSGYTDVAIGSALLLGIRFPLNFNAPYKAHDIQDFWRRWHISLSTWLRDYLYIPLGGNRKGKARTYINLMATMLLGGLWHGASWTFVVWGGMHGAALAANRAWGRGRTPSRWGKLLGVVLTFHFVCVTWIFFRSDSFSHAYLMLTQLGQLTTHAVNLHNPVLAVLALGLGTHFVPERWFQNAKNAFIAAPTPAQGFVLCCAAFVLREMISAEAVPFVYFQF